MRIHRPVQRLGQLDRFIAATVVASIGAVVFTAIIDHRLWVEPTHWQVTALFGAMLIFGELHSVGWLRLRDGGEVTPGWAFAYAILLAGSPTIAMLGMATASILPDLRRRKGLRRTAFNAAQTVIALSVAVAILTITGFHDALTVRAGFSPFWLLAIMGAALGIFLTNSVLTCVVIALNLGVSVTSMLRKATGLSISADGALLVLSPLFVIAADFSIVTIPLLGLVAFLVYNSARQALEREHRASHDHLTNLLNARAFNDHINSHLDTARHAPSRGCVLLLDLDGFKDLNDRLGHQIGDEVLRCVGEQLRFDRAYGAVAARLGGDEFAVFIPEAENEEAALHLAHEVATRLRTPLEVNGFPISITASIGVTLIDATVTSAEQVLRNADLAMYQAKRHKTIVELHTIKPHGDHSGGRISLLAELVRALAGDELWLGYQPQVDLRTGRIRGFEALLRWNHPTLGAVQPNDFISLAEHTDLIVDITERVIDMACTDAKLLLAFDPEIRIAVNVSTRNLRHRHFPNDVQRLLTKHDLPASVLEIELTESAFAVQPDVTTDTIHALRALGISIAMDDFGSGYSSFARLLDMPVDKLKIDQSLIRNMTSDPRSFLVIRAVLDLCGALGLISTAEGVESIETINQLRELGCQLVQGFAVARPMPVGDAVKWLAEHPIGLPLVLERQP